MSTRLIMLIIRRKTCRYNGLFQFVRFACDSRFYIDIFTIFNTCFFGSVEMLLIAKTTDQLLGCCPCCYDKNLLTSSNL